MKDVKKNMDAPISMLIENRRMHQCSFSTIVESTFCPLLISIDMEA
jgi:hypothetical protein